MFIFGEKHFHLFKIWISNVYLDGPLKDTKGQIFITQNFCVLNRENKKEKISKTTIEYFGKLIFYIIDKEINYKYLEVIEIFYWVICTKKVQNSLGTQL